MPGQYHTWLSPDLPGNAVVFAVSAHPARESSVQSMRVDYLATQYLSSGTAGASYALLNNGPWGITAYHAWLSGVNLDPSSGSPEDLGRRAFAIHDTAGIISEIVTAPIGLAVEKQTALGFSMTEIELPPDVTAADLESSEAATEFAAGFLVQVSTTKLRAAVVER
ncbi:hypothetical protein ACGF13_35655 [Kitasatospora sp. NPDC048286]|uniref:hypothetical protein n=1 Tax=unclassified Kitasatospora TaxID=2633591 RepID=UPI0037157027